MSLLGQLWVKLGLKDDEFHKGIERSKGKAKSFGDDLKKTGNKVKAGWAAVAGAILLAWQKIGKEMTQQTQIIGDKWGELTAGMSAAWGEFVSRIGTGRGMKGLWESLKETYNTAKNVQVQLDEMFERTNSLSVKEQEIGIENSKLYKQLRNINLSYQERLKAGNQIVANTRELARMQQDAARQEYDAALKMLQLRTGLSEEDVQFFIFDYEKNKPLIEAAQVWNKLQNGTLGDTEDMAAAMATVAKYTQEELTYALRVNDAYNLANDTLVKGVVDAYVKILNIERQSEESLNRVSSSVNGIVNSIMQLNTMNVPEVELQQADWSWRVDELMDDFLSFEMPEHDLSAVDEFNKKLEDGTRRTQELANVFHSAVVDSVVSAVSELSEALASGESLSSGKFISAVLSPLADAAISAGTLILSTGLGIEGILESLSTLNPVAAIAAGTALIAIGTAAKVGLASIAEQGNTTPSYSYSGGYGFNVAAQVPQDYEVKVTGTLKGQDIYLASEKYQQSRRR